MEILRKKQLSLDRIDRIEAKTKELDESKSVTKTMQMLELENKELQVKVDRYEDVIKKKGLWQLLGRKPKSHEQGR